MKEKKIRSAAFVALACAFLGVIALIQNAPAIEENKSYFEESIWDYSTTEQISAGEENGWSLYDNMGTQEIFVEGKVDSTDYPYGYNVGTIEDEQIGKAVLITPGTAIHIKDLIIDDSILNIEYLIHPWVAGESDGLILNIDVCVGEVVETFSYEVDAYGKKQTQNITLEQFYNDTIDIELYVTNYAESNEICDWLVLQDFSIREDITDNLEIFGSNGYVKSATYFADAWPINFWNSEMNNLETDLQQIKQDGFNSIILVIPWREFQPGVVPIVYNEYAFEKLDKVMRATEAAGLDVYARIGYTWDYYEDENENIVDRYCQLLGNPDVQQAWYAYVEKMYMTLSSYSNFKEGFLTWEDFWNTLGVCDEVFETARKEKAGFIGYQAWIASNYEITEYNSRYGTKYESYNEIPVPQRDEPAMEAMYSFYDDFLNTILKNSQTVFPNLSMEVRIDWDVVYQEDGSINYFKHTETFPCVESDFTSTMYGIPMGFENVGERVSYTEAMEKTEYILQQLRLQNGGKPVYIEQFIFADNTPKFKNNAQIKETEINNYLENVAEILLEYSEGYGIWTYRNYRANMLYNSQFALNDRGWECSEGVEFITIDDTCACEMESNESIKQKIPRVRNHFDANEYILEFEVLAVEEAGNMSISMGGKSEIVEITEPGMVTVVFPKGLSFDVEIAAKDCAVVIDNIELYSQIQQGYLYNENNEELECAAGIRVLNSNLE